MKNLKAAANSKKPITTFIEFSHPPLLGNLDKYCGNSAKKKKGNAKAVEKLSIPIIGQKYVNFVHKCNACHEQFADGEHLQEP